MQHVARREAVAAVARDRILDHDAEVGDEVRDAADVLRDQAALRRPAARSSSRALRRSSCCTRCAAGRPTSRRRSPAARCASTSSVTGSSRCFGAATIMRRTLRCVTISSPLGATVSSSPGKSTVVEAYSQTIAGPLTRAPGAEPLAVVDRAGARDSPRSSKTTGARAISASVAAGGNARKLRALAPAAGREPDVDDLDRLVRRLGGRSGGRGSRRTRARMRRDVAAGDRLRADRRLNRELLTDVADVEEALHRDRLGRVPSSAKQRARLGDHRRRRCARSRRNPSRPATCNTCARSRGADRPAACRAPRNGPGTRGTIKRRDVQFARDLGRVQRPPAPPNADHREIARIVAALDRDAAHRQRHLGDRDLHDAQRRLVRPRGRAARRSSSRIASRAAVDVERHLAAQKAVRD